MRTWLAPLILALVLSPATMASARASTEYTYRYDQLWQATIRLLRVDLGCQITDRDDEIGFVMFEYPGAAGRTHSGSVELVRSTDAHGTERVRVTVVIPTMPTYIEQHVMTRLAHKLREDFGLPPRVHVTRPPPTEGDGDMHDEEPPAEAPPSDTVSSIE